MMKLLILVSVFASSAMAAEPPENTLRPDFISQIQPISEKVFSGRTPEGRECSALVRRFDDGRPMAYGTYTTYNVFATLGKMPRDFVHAKNQNDLDDSNPNRDVFRASAGWCENLCGARWQDGRVSGFGKRLEFYNAGESPQTVPAIIDLNSDKTQIARVRFQKYGEWYIPGFGWAAKKTVFDCAMSK